MHVPVLRAEVPECWVFSRSTAVQDTKIVDNFVLGKEAGSKSVTKIGGADDAVIYALPPRMVWDWVEEVEEETLNVQQSRERGQGISSNSFLQVFQLTEIKQVRSSPRARTVARVALGWTTESGTSIITRAAE